MRSNSDAWGLVMSNYGTITRWACTEAPRDKATRDDLIQVAVLSSHNAAVAWDESRGVPFVAFARTCARNAFITWKSKMLACMFSPGEYRPPPHPFPMPVERMVKCWCVTVARKRLPLCLGMVLRAVEDGFSHHQIADALGLTRQAIQKRIIRAREQFRVELREVMEGMNETYSTKTLRCFRQGPHVARLDPDSLHAYMGCRATRGCNGIWKDSYRRLQTYWF